MADNVTVQSDAPASAAAGTVFAFDEIAGVKHARSKTGFGADGSYTDVSASDPLPVVQTGTPSLPTGAATSAKQDTLIGHVDGIETLLGTIDADTGNIATSSATIAGAVSGTEMQVDVLTMPTVAVTGTFWQATQPVSGTVTANAGSGPFPVSDNAGSLTVDAPVGTPVFVRLSNGSSAIATLPVSLASLPALAAGTNAIGKLAANSGVDIGDVDVTSTVLPTANTNSAVTSVADTASSTTLLSSSGSRKGFRITNTSSAVLYVKYGTTASASDFTVRLPQWAYLEENFYSGRVDGIWASDPGDGAALITSLSA